jgi:YHS domain-containing protein
MFDSSWDFYGYGEGNFQGISVASFNNGKGRKTIEEYLKGLDTTPTNACTGTESTISFGPTPQLRITCPTKYEIYISSGYTRSDYNIVNFGDHYSDSMKPSAVIIENIRGEVVDINTAFNLWGEEGDGGGTVTTLEQNVKTNESITIEGKKYYFSRYTHHIEYSETPAGQPCKSVKDICYTYITTLKVVNVPIGDSSYIIAIRQDEKREYSGGTLINTSKVNDTDIAEMMRVFETIKKY